MLFLQNYCKIYQEVLSSSNACKHTGVLACKNSPLLAKGRKYLTVRNAVPPQWDLCTKPQKQSSNSIYTEQAGQNKNPQIRYLLINQTGIQMMQDFWLHLMYRSNKPYGKNQFPRLIKRSIQVISSSYLFKTDTRNWTETKLITQMVAYQPWNGNSLLLIQFRSGANDLGVKSYQSHNEFIEPFFDSHTCGEKTALFLFLIKNNGRHFRLICYLPFFPWLTPSARKPGPFPTCVLTHLLQLQHWSSFSKCKKMSAHMWGKELLILHSFSFAILKLTPASSLCMLIANESYISNYLLPYQNK